MIRLLLFVIVASIVVTASYFLMKRDGKKKELAVLGGGLVAAGFGIVMQFVFPLYLSLLGIVAVALMATLIYMKLLEKENQRKQQLLEERKVQKNIKSSRSDVSEEYEQPVSKSFEMQTISVVREEQKVGQ